MAKYLGINAVNEGNYYFISYNTEDASKIEEIIKEMDSRGIELWYDYGLKVGHEWETEIVNNIQKCEAIIMFISKNIFLKEKSYVHKEYEIAVHFKKKIYIVLLDNINDSEIPNSFISWWIDIKHLQCIEFTHCNGVIGCVNEIFKAIGSKECEEKVMSDIESVSAHDVRNSIIPYNLSGNGYTIAEESTYKEDLPFLMSIKDVFTINKSGVVIVGMVQRGQVNLYDTIEILGFRNQPHTAIVNAIECNHELRNFATVGEEVGLLLKNKGIKVSDIEIGYVATRPNTIALQDDLKCEVKLNQGVTLFNNKVVQVDLGPIEVQGTVYFDENQEQILGKKRISIKLIVPIANEKGWLFNLLDEDGYFIGTGKVVD